MKPQCFILSIVSLKLLVAGIHAGEPYDLAFSAYIGGSAGEGIRDLEVDGHGNIYVAGTTHVNRKAKGQATRS